MTNMQPTEHVVLRAAGGFKKHAVVPDETGRYGAALCGFKPGAAPSRRQGRPVQRVKRARWTRPRVGDVWCPVCRSKIGGAE